MYLPGRTNWPVSEYLPLLSLSCASSALTCRSLLANSLVETTGAKKQSRERALNSLPVLFVSTSANKGSQEEKKEEKNTSTCYTRGGKVDYQLLCVDNTEETLLS